MQPTRMCAVCRERKLKNDLIRVAKTSEGEILLDAAGRAFGRGVYICKNQECIKNAEKKRVFERSFKRSVDVRIYEKLRELGDRYDDKNR